MEYETRVRIGKAICDFTVQYPYAVWLPLGFIAGVSTVWQFSVYFRGIVCG